MASKRIKNQLYWMAVKETATSDGMSFAKETYRRALHGHTDNELSRDIELLQSVYGTHHVHTDLHNAELWPARTVVDAIRQAS